MENEWIYNLRKYTEIAIEKFTPKFKWPQKQNQECPRRDSSRKTSIMMQGR